MQLTFIFVVSWVNHFEEFQCDSSCALVFVHAENTLQHLHHFFLRFVPHRSAGVDAWDRVCLVLVVLLLVRRVDGLDFFVVGFRVVLLDFIAPDVIVVVSLPVHS